MPSGFPLESQTRLLNFSATATKYLPMDSDHPQSHKPHPKPTQLLSSAKVVAGAAKSALRHEAEKIDRAEVASAAADLIGAAAHYANLEEKRFGKYVGKAEDYLHHYHSSHSATAANSSTATAAAAAADSSSPNLGGSGEGHHAGGGLEDYLKMAQGFLKKD